MDKEAFTNIINALIEARAGVEEIQGLPDDPGADASDRDFYRGYDAGALEGFFTTQDALAKLLKAKYPDLWDGKKFWKPFIEDRAQRAA